MMDVFEQDLWRFRPMVAAINKPPYTPQAITSMNLFEWRPQTTDTISVELLAGTQSLLVETSRHGNPTEVLDDKPSAVPLQIRAHKQHATIWADEVMGRRQWGTDAVMKSVESVRNTRIAKARRNFDLTREFRYFGAIMGRIPDHTGTTTLHNFYTIFNITPPSTVFMDFGGATAGALMAKVNGAKRSILTSLGGIMPTGFKVLGDDAFMDAFVKNVEVRESWDRYRDSEFFRSSYVFSGFTWGGISWEEYRPAPGITANLAAGQAVMFPTGVPDMFIEAGAPAPWFDAVENPALPFYSMATVHPKRTHLEIDMESHTLPINTRPDAIRILDKDAS